jgi:hypothetical protein
MVDVVQLVKIGNMIDEVVEHVGLNLTPETAELAALVDDLQLMFQRYAAKELGDNNA